MVGHGTQTGSCLEPESSHPLARASKIDKKTPKDVDSYLDYMRCSGQQERVWGDEFTLLGMVEKYSQPLVIHQADTWGTCTKLEFPEEPRPDWHPAFAMTFLRPRHFDFGFPSSGSNRAPEHDEKVGELTLMVEQAKVDGQATGMDEASEPGKSSDVHKQVGLGKLFEVDEQAELGEMSDTHQVAELGKACEVDGEDELAIEVDEQSEPDKTSDVCEQAELGKTSEVNERVVPDKTSDVCEQAELGKTS